MAAASQMDNYMMGQNALEKQNVVLEGVAENGV